MHVKNSRQGFWFRAFQAAEVATHRLAEAINLHIEGFHAFHGCLHWSQRRFQRHLRVFSFLCSPERIKIIRHRHAGLELKRIIARACHRRGLTARKSQQQKARLIKLTDDRRLAVFEVQSLRWLGLHAVFGENADHFAIHQRFTILHRFDGEGGGFTDVVERICVIS